MTGCWLEVESTALLGVGDGLVLATGTGVVLAAGVVLVVLAAILFPGVGLVVLALGLDCTLLAVVAAGFVLVKLLAVPGEELVKDELLRFSGKLMPTNVPSRIATATANMTTAMSLFIS